MKRRYYTKVCETLHKMTKYISICEMRQGIIHYIVLCNNQNKIDNFSIEIAKTETTFLLIDLIEKSYSNSKDKNLYRDNFNRKDLAGINKTAEILNKKDLAGMDEIQKCQI